MIEVWIYTLISVFIISLVSFIGILSFSIEVEKLRTIVIYLVSFSAGALFGDAFIHLLPEVFSRHGFSISVSISLLSGILLFFIMEKFVHWRHCHMPITEHHTHPFAVMNLVGDGMHNFLDGMIIAASYLLSVPAGIATSIAVFLHEIPQEVGDFGVLIHGGFSNARAVWTSFLIGLIAVIGALAALAASKFAGNIEFILIPLAAGGFIYIAGSDLIPELHKETAISKSAMQIICFILGIAVMMILLLIN